jgi:hypothetical protein
MESTITMPQMPVDCQSTKHENRNSDIQKMFTCQKCHAKFKTKDNLTNHLKRKTPCHLKPDEDEFYLKQFYRKLEASDPRFNPRSSYMCITCLGLFKSPSNVKIHVQSVHLGRKPYACERFDFQWNNYVAIIFRTINTILS